MSIMPSAIEGTCVFRDWRTWFRVTGSLGSKLTPLVVLHGGPGAAHNYTLRIANVARSGRAVVHYDQLGVGQSTHLPNQPTDFWTVELFLEELDNLLGHLGIADSYHLLGQSWGGMLAAEHAVRRPRGLRSLVIANSPASMDLWVREADRLRGLLPESTQLVLRAHEQDGTTDHPDYLAATKEFYHRFVCRVVPNPPEVVASDEATAADPTVYHTMNGPNEFHVVGTLRDWTIVDRIPRIDVPTLLINGAHDEATAITMQPFYDRIPNVEWTVFENSSHMPHVEEESRYLDVLNTFLIAHDGTEKTHAK
jgi:L-proline amide hydrolase